jgi:hypothetical protein
MAGDKDMGDLTGPEAGGVGDKSDTSRYRGDAGVGEGGEAPRRGGAVRATVGFLEGKDVKALQGDKVSSSGEGGGARGEMGLAGHIPGAKAEGARLEGGGRIYKGGGWCQSSWTGGGRGSDTRGQGSGGGPYAGTGGSTWQGPGPLCGEPGMTLGQAEWQADWQECQEGRLEVGVHGTPVDAAGRGISRRRLPKAPAAPTPAGGVPAVLLLSPPVTLRLSGIPAACAGRELASLLFMLSVDNGGEDCSQAKKDREVWEGRSQGGRPEHGQRDAYEANVMET